nr:MAG TPA: hypothetical protein [Caudoviricetes sp.]
MTRSKSALESRSEVKMTGLGLVYSGISNNQTVRDDPEQISLGISFRSQDDRIRISLQEVREKSPRNQREFSGLPRR